MPYVKILFPTSAYVGLGHVTGYSWRVGGGGRGGVGWVEEAYVDSLMRETRWDSGTLFFSIE